VASGAITNDGQITAPFNLPEILLVNAIGNGAGCEHRDCETAERG
jgi:hypothetical protein